MEFEFRLEQKEYSKGVTSILFDKPIIKVFILVLAFFFFGRLYSILSEGETSSLYSWIIVGLVFALIVPFSFTRSIKKQFNRNPRLRELVKYEVNEEHIRIAGETYQCDLSHSQVFKVKDTKELLLIYENKEQAHLIPKRVLKPEQLESIKKWLNKPKTG